MKYVVSFYYTPAYSKRYFDQQLFYKEVTPESGTEREALKIAMAAFIEQIYNEPGLEPITAIGSIKDQMVVPAFVVNLPQKELYRHE